MDGKHPRVSASWELREKGVHLGDNLVGEYRQLASECLLIRAYRASMILIGCVSDPDMFLGTENQKDEESPLASYTKPGVYSVYLSAYFLNYDIYHLAIDKVHSDYGGVPMKLAPGSKMETGIKPLVDSTRANITLAELTMGFYNSPVKLAQRLGVEGALVNK